MRNINIVSRDACTGCGACQNVCNKKAIVMRPGKGGFLEPHVDEAYSCISCGLCIDVCPTINPMYRTDSDPKTFIVKASDDIRGKSSSGGIFRVLAHHIMSEGGFVVGTIYDEGCRPVMMITDDPSDIERMSGSKYIETSAGSIYRDVKKALESGRTVLFTGSPCHIAALNNYLGKDYDDLYTVDIVCHGALSYEMFASYAKKRLGSLPVSADFRDKKINGWGSGNVKYVMDGGKEIVIENDTYVRLFGSNMGNRSSCIDCRFAEPPRQGDLSMGDYWNAKYNDKEKDDGLGISVLTVNSLKGMELFLSVRRSFQMCEPTSYRNGLTWNRNKRNLPTPGYRPRFLSLFDSTDDLLGSYDRTINWRYDVGIFGVVNNPNYGGLLTYYALYKTIERMGYSVIMINNPIRHRDSVMDTHSRRFFSSHTNMSVQRTSAEQYRINDHVDTVVLGSDQVWNYSLFESWGMMLYLDFVDPSKRIVSYAASFGHDRHTVPENRLQDVNVNLERFDAISVREKEGVRILKDDFGIGSEWVLDPVFLMEPGEYERLSNDSRIDLDRGYVGSYILNPTAGYRLDILKDVSKRMESPIKVMTDGDPRTFDRKKDVFRDNGLDVMENVTIEDWIKVIKHSDFFVTDSFHASCICIMFKKKFLLVQNNWATSRLETLMGLFGLEDRWVKCNRFSEYHFNTDWLEPLDNVHIDGIWRTEKNRCLKWLSDALKMEKTYMEIRKEPAPMDMGRLDDIRSKGRFLLVEHDGDGINLMLMFDGRNHQDKITENGKTDIELDGFSITVHSVKDDIVCIVRSKDVKTIEKMPSGSDMIMELTDDGIGDVMSLS